MTYTMVVLKSKNRFITLPIVGCILDTVTPWRGVFMCFQTFIVLVVHILMKFTSASTSVTCVLLGTSMALCEVILFPTVALTNRNM